MLDNVFARLAKEEREEGRVEGSANSSALNLRKILRFHNHGELPEEVEAKISMAQNAQDDKTLNSWLFDIATGRTAPQVFGKIMMYTSKVTD